MFESLLPFLSHAKSGVVLMSFLHWDPAASLSPHRLLLLLFCWRCRHVFAVAAAVAAPILAALHPVLLLCPVSAAAGPAHKAALPAGHLRVSAGTIMSSGRQAGRQAVGMSSKAAA